MSRQNSRLALMVVAMTLAAGVFSRPVLAQCAAIAVQPTSTKICTYPGGVAVFEVGATGSNLTYQWQQQDLGDTFPDFIDLHDGLVYDTVFNLFLRFTAAGTNTNRLVLTEDQGYGQVFRCVVTNSCGSVETNEVYMLHCRLDYDCSGAVSIDDLFVFINSWLAQEQRADYDHSGEVAIDDLFIFINAWLAGC